MMMFGPRPNTSITIAGVAATIAGSLLLLAIVQVVGALILTNPPIVRLIEGLIVWAVVIPLVTLILLPVSLIVSVPVYSFAYSIFRGQQFSKKLPGALAAVTTTPIAAFGAIKTVEFLDAPQSWVVATPYLVGFSGLLIGAPLAWRYGKERGEV